MYEDPMPYFTPDYTPSMETEEERRKRKEEEEERRREEESRQYESQDIESGGITPIRPDGGFIDTVKKYAEKIKPVSPGQAAYTAQQESGANPDIGYHDTSKGTAYGKYGITAPQYEEIQKRDPQFANRPITSLSGADQTNALSASNDVYARQLQAKGIDPSESNVRAAHLVGAGGVSQRQKQGTFNQAAIANNGGVENLERLYQGRLAGGQSASSGASGSQAGAGRGFVNPALVQPVDPGALSTERIERVAENMLPGGDSPYASMGTGLKMPGGQPATPGAATQGQNTAALIDKYQTIQNDPKELMKFAFSENTPGYLQDRAKDQLLTQYDQQKKLVEAEKTLATMGQRDIAATLSKKSEGNSVGDWIQYLLFKHVGLTDLANMKGEQLGIGHKWQQSTYTDKDGNAVGVEIQTTASGKIIGGTKMDGTALSSDELNKAQAGMAMKGAHQSPEIYADPSGRLKGNFVLETRPGQSPVFRETGTGRIATPTESAALSKMGVKGTLETQSASQLQRLRNELPFAGETARVKALGEFDAMNGTNYLGQYQQNAPQFFAAIGIPGAAQQPQQQPRQPGQSVSSAVVQSPTSPAPAQVQQNVEIQKAERLSFNKFVDEELTPKAAAGSNISSIRRQQISGPDGILNNPELAGIMQGTGNNKAEMGNMLRDVFSGKLSPDSEEFSRRINALGLTTRQKDVLNVQLGLQKQLAPETLKSVVGPGAVSEAEHKMNRDAGIDITKQPLYSGLSLMTRSQFISDQAQAKAVFKESNPQLASTSAFNNAWASEKAKLDKQYDGIYAARAAYNAKYNANGNNPGAVVDAFKHYPTPEWNPETRKWELNGYSAKAARPPLSAFN